MNDFHFFKTKHELGEKKNLTYVNLCVNTFTAVWAFTKYGLFWDLSVSD